MNGTTALHRAGGGVQEPSPVKTITVIKNEAGYGMKVSGDNPVYVQSVKEGGAAAQAGLHAGDKIIKVNDVNVMQSTHTEVVQLIKSSMKVDLTVQQKPPNTSQSGLQVGTTTQQQRPTSLTPLGHLDGHSLGLSPSQTATSLHRALTAPAGSSPSTARITGPQPVDRLPTLPVFASTPSKRNHEKRLQLETERVHTFQLMLLEEQTYVDKLRSELAKASATSGNSSTNTTLQTKLLGAEKRIRILQEQLQPAAITTKDPLCSLVTNASTPYGHYSSSVNGGGVGDVPPPLPSRKYHSMRSLSPPPLPPRPQPASNTHNIAQSELERHLLTHLTPPTTSHGIPNSFSQGANLTSPTLNSHQRTKSSPEQLGTTIISPSEASRRLIASESMNDLSPSRQDRHSGIDLDDPVHITPPGTPPPPYPQPTTGLDISSSALNDSISDNYVTPSRQQLNDSSFGLPPIQQSIISMEDDDMSDQEVGQLEDHGPFKSLSRLWEHHAHLSVFINYVLSNSDPSSLLFYLVTNLYKEGNAKEMRKWAYEIHSSFLVPGAPLRLNNVDENVACEIDEVLTNSSDKEEILRKIFWKARTRAKEELNEQLADFQQKRTAGLGMLFGPSDAQLDESDSDKSREQKIIETLLLPKMDPYIEDLEKDQIDLRNLTTAAGLTTILTKIFQVRHSTLDRVPTFIAKGKSDFKARFTGKKSKMNVRGHHFAATQYYTVANCNHCQLIIGGIGPQGFQCTDCAFSAHRQCVRVMEENCPGPVPRKERANGISKIMERIRPDKRPPSSHHHHHATNHMLFAERVDSAVPDGENGEHRGGGASGNARSSTERGRISAYDHPDSMDDPSSREDISEMVQKNISSKPKTSNINRSESYKERIHHKKQLREKRKTSDPNLSKTKTGYSDCDAAGAFPGNSAGSSSNSSLSTRSLDSPSTSLEQVHPANAGNNNTSTSWDSDVDVEADPPDWSYGVAEDVLSCLSNAEKKRQEVINELFHTERSHVRALKVLSYVFYKPLLESQVLPPDQIQLLFSNLDEMVTIHSSFNQSMKRKKKENPCVGDVGELILDMFDGENGEAFERAASIYCAKQQVALDALRDRRRKDPKLNSFLNEIEANPLCRRLQLKDHILTGMLRLTKYPLLFENLAKYTPPSNEKERAAVLRAVDRSKEILSVVNQAVKEAEDCQRLIEILRMIDRSAFDKFDHPTVQEFKNFDITKRTLIFEGPLLLRILNRQKPVELHVVLLDDMILLLHRQDEKYLLKFMSANQSNSVLSPIVKISTVLVRKNAVDKNSLYLVNTSQKDAQMYDLMASNYAEMKTWCKHISATVEAYHKARKIEGRRHSPPTVMNEEESSPTPEVQVESGAIEKDKNDKEPKVKDSELNLSVNQNPPEENTTEPTPPDYTPSEDTPVKNKSENNLPGEVQNTPVTGNNESMRLVTCTQCSLIDPIEVHAEIRPIHVAEPVLTPIECLRRKDEVIKQALVEKQSLVADILNIPKEDFEHVADMASETTGVEKEPAELILAAINQANQLVGMINSALAVTETETILAARGTNAAASSGCEATGCPLPRTHPHPNQPVISVVALQPICHSLTTQLSQLLKIVKEREEERERLRKELRRNRERLHAFDADAQRRDTQLQFSTNTTQTPTDVVDYSTIESTEDMNKDEFLDACTGPEAETTPAEIKETAKTEVMGDSVG